MRSGDTERIRRAGAPAPGSRALRTRSRKRAMARRRQLRRRRTALAGAVVASAAAAAFLYVAPPWQDDGSALAADREPARPPGNGSVSSSAPATPEASASPKPSPSPKTPKSPGGSRNTEETVDPDSVPASGPGTFTVAREGVSSGGGGSRYRVEVEDGIGVDPDSAAEEIAEILADPRGWGKDGSRTFRQVADGPAGLVIRIGTPKTTDRLCGHYGLNTGGEVNCRGGENVMVNLARWQLGSPTFDGPASEYRALIINHEVGHWLGHGHETCPGPGKPAPAMMQQIKGLKGCTSNAWPYDEKGRYLGGPSVP
ncbi:DUF3152 domain-containing protein [Streptomyces sp. NPDC005752]|uniref:DUF3152 domain-containing protein n=1 Tax=Streptomyces sp. NPDC005752 TaxID=3157065 RepID=UPI0033D8833A